MPTRRRIVASSVIASATASFGARAQGHPGGPVKMIVSFRIY